VQLAEDLAARGALALDNAQAYDSALISRQSAESANQAKTAFLGAVSHELRTPLNAIGGYVELVEMGLRGPVTAEQRSDLAQDQGEPAIPPLADYRESSTSPVSEAVVFRMRPATSTCSRA
jgi:signal transduction histidine kinase